MGYVSPKGKSTRQFIWREKELKFWPSFYNVYKVLIQKFIYKLYKLEARPQNCLSVGVQENKRSETPVFWLSVCRASDFADGDIRFQL